MNKRNVVRTVVISFVIVIICTAFVAPIPATSEAEILQAIADAPVLDGYSPKIGPFEIEESFEYNNTKMKIQVSGETYVEDGCIMVKYVQEFYTFDSADTVLSKDNFQRELKLSELLTNPESQKPIIYPVSQSILSSDWGSFTYYIWNGWVMIKAPGSTQQAIDYEHPDNYYHSLYHPGQFNLNWFYRSGSSRYVMHHYSQTDVNTALNTASIFGIILAAITSICTIWTFITLPATAMTAVALGALMAAIGIYQLFFYVWLDMVLQSEQGDGFSYSYAQSDGWVQCSYGGWKDFWILSYYTGGSL